MLIFVVSISTVLAAPEFEGSVKSNAVMLLDAATGKVLYEKNADEIIRPASTTKIMTCIVALENSTLDEEVKVGPEGDWTGSGYSLLGTKNGEKIIMKDLLTGLMLKSGNDAAEAVAVHIGDSVDGFVRMMNQKARDLGMSNTTFKNPHGVDKDGHQVTARDMSKLALYAMQNEDFMDIVGKAVYTMPKTNKNPQREVENTNHLIRSDLTDDYYKYATGIKTGSTPIAKRCVVASAKKGDTELLCLIFGDETTDGVERWPLAKNLFEFGFNNYSTINVQSIIDSLPATSAQVTNTVEENVVIELAAANTGETFITLPKDVAEDVINNSGYETTVEYYSGSELTAPIKQGDSVGIITLRSTMTKDVICRAELTATCDVEGNGTVEVPDETPKPSEAPAETPDDIPVDGEGFVVGIGWLWLVLAAVLIAVIVFLTISLIKHRG